MSDIIHRAPEHVGSVVRGKTLTSLLYEASDRYANARAYNRRSADGWQAMSLDEFTRQVEEVAVGLLELGMQRGDRVALFMESDPYFCLADMACLLAGLVDAPIYLTHGDESVGYVLQHSGARAVFVSSSADLDRISRLSNQTPALKFAILVETEPQRGSGTVDSGLRVITLEALRILGRRQIDARPEDVPALRDAVQPDDLATIIYTSGTTGRPKGVMLSHENISSNALAAFAGLRDYRPGAGGETVLSFLPLTHVFARTLQYGHMAYGTSVYFTEPDHVSEDLKQVRPTIFATVPRLLEKVYTRIRERAALETGVKKMLLRWALDLAHQFDTSKEPSGVYQAKRLVADKLVYAKWREALGGRVKYIISGGAALSPELSTVFAAAGVTVLQGYGLTETSPIISYNRPEHNRPETVGILLPGVEVRIAEDGEILTRGPHVMMGYYQDPERTAEAIDEDGWLHTGDIGEMSPDGFLRLTDRKKDLFKLSTGKYVMPQPLESRLTTEPLVEQVVVVGAGYKYCTALIFPDQDVLRTFARSRQIDPKTPLEALIRHPAVVARYERLVDKANRGLDPWSTIKRFMLIPEHLSIDSGLLTPTMKVRRSQVQQRYADQIKALYEATGEDGEDGAPRTDQHAQAVTA